MHHKIVRKILPQVNLNLVELADWERSVVNVQKTEKLMAPLFL